MQAKSSGGPNLPSVFGLLLKFQKGWARLIHGMSSLHSPMNELVALNVFKLSMCI